jgi:nitrate/nitrite-specific signal transduction histidine kinase
LYQSYDGEPVLGYFKQLDSLDAYIIAEVPREFVVQSSINSLLSSSALAAFAILIAIAAVVISAESIADPISALAKVAEKFAAGQFATRAAIERRDEIGALGRTYNQMADQLQDVIDKLEQRVADRTKELEDQSLRLRTSAEIARDAASSHSLTTLLERAGSLILERFGLYHTGIFLIDSNREFAVLASSPTEAGKQMMANGHKLRVGEVGIVGRAAFTGDARISLDTGTDAVFFNNPFLPKTRSEMALALKVENQVIGVLDVQSDQPQAFDENDIAIMQILADQLATAIARTRLLEQVVVEIFQLDFGPDEGVPTQVPPQVGAPYPCLVPAVHRRNGGAHERTARPQQMRSSRPADALHNSDLREIRAPRRWPQQALPMSCSSVQLWRRLIGEDTR